MLKFLLEFDNSRAPFLKAGAIFFFFTAVVALLLQVIVLPYLLPAMHAGNGLLLGTDAVGFHKIAVELAEQIRISGWSAWELRPEGQAPAGIAAVLYVIFSPSPLVMIPVNAALRAIAGLVLMRIALYLTGNLRMAFLSALLFVVFPSAMMWYGQIHKDGFYLAGLYLCLFGWVLLARLETWDKKLPYLAAVLLCWIAGAILAGSVRLYAFQQLQGIGYIFALLLGVLFIIRGIKKRLPWKQCLIAVSLLCLMPYVLRFAPVEVRISASTLGRDAGKVSAHDTDRDSAQGGGAQDITQSRAQASRTGGHNKIVRDSAEKEKPGTVDPEASWLAKVVARENWKKTSWLPGFIENNFFRIGVLREGYLTTPDYKTAGSMIDTQVHLYGFNDFLDYLPRAMQIGFAAPFPVHWLDRGASPGGTVMRRIAGVEMLLAYLTLVFIPFAVWRWKNRVEMWIPLVFGMVFVLIYAYATPNLGSLYRLRYGFLMLLVSLGAAGGLSAWHLVRQRYFEKELK